MTNEIAEATEVRCLYCGLPTPGPVLTAVRRSPDSPTESHFRVSVIRCHKCGKEAPYSASHIIPRSETTKKRAANAA